MRIAITGASGHVGGNLIRSLLQDGHSLRALVHHDHKALEGLPVEIFTGDVLDRSSLERLFTGVDLVYHLAARISIVPGEERLVHETNVIGPRNVVEASLKTGVGRLVHFSSIHAFSSQPVDRPIDEARPLCEGPDLMPYDRSKAGGEREIQAGLACGLDVVTVNPTAVLGPHDYRPSRMGTILCDLYRRSLPALVEGGFDWVDVRDVVDGAKAAAARGRRGEKYLLSGHWASVAGLAALAAEVTGRKPPRLVSPMWLARVGAPFVTTWARMAGRVPLFTSASLHSLRIHQQVSHDKAAREFGYRPRPLKETLEAVYQWFREARVLAA
jgi:dihydroflavonol-4-reductase